MKNSIRAETNVQYTNEADFVAQATSRLTALWALTEAALGGVLLAFKIPFTGLFIGSAAIIIISLMAFFNKKPGVILRATIIVMIVKGLVSPHTPITSYAAVMLQGLLGEIFFRYLSWRLAAFLLAGLALLLSAMQKFIIITLIFGMNIWNSIDLFGNFIIQQFIPNHQAAMALEISFGLIVLYSFLHLLAGLIIGFQMPHLMNRIQDKISNLGQNALFTESLPENGAIPAKKRRQFFKKISAYLLIFIGLSIIVLSYIYPVFEESRGFSVIIMIIRSVIIMSFWYFVFGPFILKRLKAFLARKEHIYAGEVDNILNSFPLLRRMVKFSWQNSKSEKKYKRPLTFLLNLLVLIITTDISPTSIIPNENRK